MTELMVTLAIAGILLTVTAPALSRFIESNRLTTATNEFVVAINSGRAEAVKRGFPAFLCESSTGTTCTANATSWKGWIVFVDNDVSGGLSANDTILQVHPALASSLKLSGPGSLIKFKTLGSLESGAGTFVVCNSKITQRRDIALTTTGQTTINAYDNQPTACP